MKDYISIAITMRNRAELLKLKLKQLLEMDYDPKKIEICIADGNSDDGILDLLFEYYKHFYQIKYAISDRNVLPFKITTNQPTCDMNSQICNQVTFEKVIRTDPEVLFTNPGQLRYISDMLDMNKNIVLWHDAISLPDGCIPSEPFQAIPSWTFNCENNTCLCFNRSAFIEYGGFEEKFALGVAAEDSYFIDWWRKNLGNVYKSPHNVYHIYHGTPWNARPEIMEIYYRYTVPLMNNLVENNIQANIDNPDWKRPEMLKNKVVLKDK